MDTVKLAKEIRRLIFRAAYAAGGGHLGGCFSLADILTVLYFDNVLKYDPKKPRLKERDRFILSKGHAGLALYAVLAKAGYFPLQELWTVGKPHASLGEHPKADTPGVEVATGSLGQGFAFSVGVAYGRKTDGNIGHVYVALGDGECEEGVVWEAAMSAAKLKLHNLTAIVDCNGLQGCDHVNDVVRFSPFADKWKAFGWQVQEIDGHDHEAIKKALLFRDPEKPVAVIAHTVKGKGVSFMENKAIWHYRMPNESELPILLKDLDMNEADLYVNDR